MLKVADVEAVDGIRKSRRCFHGYVTKTPAQIQPQYVQYGLVVRVVELPRGRLQPHPLPPGAFKPAEAAGPGSDHCHGH